MKAVLHELGNKKLYLAYNGEAMFKISETFGSINELADKTRGEGRESLQALCEVAVILAEQGELTRRYYGYEPQEIIDTSTIMQLIQPLLISDLDNAVFKAIALGYGTEIETGEDDVIDIGLAELNQKKTN